MITTMHSDQNASPPRVEVITSVQRRRRWPTAEKIRLVEETMQPGMSVSYVAVRPEGANHQWRKIPPRELSIDPVADERLGRVTGRAGAS